MIITASYSHSVDSEDLTMQETYIEAYNMKFAIHEGCWWLVEGDVEEDTLVNKLRVTHAHRNIVAYLNKRLIGIMKSLAFNQLMDATSDMMFDEWECTYTKHDTYEKLLNPENQI